MQQLRVAAVVGCAIVLGLAGCRGATQITLVLSTDVPRDRWQGATITVGAPDDVEAKDPQTTTSACDEAGDLGSLVLVPSSDKTEHLVVRVVGGDGRSLETCAAPSYGAGCIVARRSLRFIPHTPLTLIVSLREACSGVVCAPDQTCDPATARCTDSAIDPELCSGLGCDDSALSGSDAGAPDAARPVDGVAPSDAGSTADAVADGADAAIADAASDVALGAFGAPCTESAQCLGGCCCSEITATPTTACDQRAACNAEAYGCVP